MSCVLRVSGQSLDLDALLVEAKAKPNRVWLKGEPRLQGARLNETSGATFVMSGAEFSGLESQKQDVLVFLNEHSSWLSSVSARPGVSVVADFGVELNPPYWASFAFEPHLLAALSQAGVTLELSTYPSGSEGASDA